MATGRNIRISNVIAPTTQIVANHSIIADFTKIPAAYIAEVKKMWWCYPGESHALGVRQGLELLEVADATYAVGTDPGNFPYAYTDQYLRATPHNRSVSIDWWDQSAGESDWYTWYAADPLGAKKDKLKTTLLYCKNTGPAMSALAFGWCWDVFWHNDPGGTVDPVYGCHWAGASVDGPDGDVRWGLDSGDYALTGNHVCLDTYLGATQSFIDYCVTNTINTKIIFTTGPVDSYSGENGYQGYQKYKRIRDYVLADASRILFDYADILCYDDNGTPTTTTWDGHTYPIITTTNLGDASIGHIGSAGQIRLAKAQWWMLARIAGWDGK